MVGVENQQKSDLLGFVKQKCQSLLVRLYSLMNHFPNYNRPTLP